MEAIDYSQAAEIARNEFMEIITRDGNEEELHLWRQSVRERFPAIYKDLLITVRDSLAAKTKAAS